jgi:hypothetical protein
VTRLRDKVAFRQSATTVWRERAPTSPEIANRGNVNMVMDFSRQQSVVPNSLGQTTRYGENDRNFQTMNRNGSPFALDVMMGGSPDPRASNKGPKMQKTQQLTPRKGR